MAVVVAALGLASFVQGCAVKPLPTWSPGPNTSLGLALASGTLALDDGCIVLQSGGFLQVLVWPPGYTARGDPLTVFDRHGNTVATVGDKVSVGGNPSGRETGCRVRDAWVVGEVIPGAGRS